MRSRKKKVAAPVATPTPVTQACIECGRGAINATLLPPPYDTIDTTLELVVCTDEDAHRPPGGRHLGRCGGWVFRHRNDRICAAVKRVAVGVQPAVSSGAN